MGPLSGHLTWTKEDDFKLRKAAETGMSFESLARGDVQFSRKFNHKDFQDRWLAILYDPAVSAESSARMLEFEHSDSAPVVKTDFLGNTEENIPASGKRKPESIRKRYYAMRKKMRDHPLTPPSVLPATDVGEPLQSDEPDGFLTYEVAHTADIYLDDNQETLHHEHQNYIVGEESDEFQEIYDMLEDVEPELPAIDDQPCIESPNEYSIIGRDQNSPTGCSGGAELESQLFGYATTAVTSADILLAELQHNLMDLSTVDDFPVMDADYIERFSSALLDSPNRELQHDYIADEFIHNYHTETKIMEGLLPPTKPSTSGIICTLNTEDPEIPANDDVFLLNLVPSTSNEMKMEASKAPSYRASKSTRVSGAYLNKDFSVSKPISPRKSSFEKSQFLSPIIGSQFRSEKLRDHNIKQEFSSNDGQDQRQIRSGFMSRSNLLPASDMAVTIKTEDKTGGKVTFTSPTRLNGMAFNHDIHPMVGNNDTHAMVGNSGTHAMVGKNGTHAMVGENGTHAMVGKNGTHAMVCNNDTHAMVGNNDTHAMVGNNGIHAMVGNNGTHTMAGNYGMHSMVGKNDTHAMVGNKDTHAIDGYSDTHAMFCNSDKHAMAVLEEPSHVEILSTELVNPDPIARNLPTLEKPLLSESDDEDDIPNFSDVEAMILDEDPSLDEQNIYLNGIGSSNHLQTFKYENADDQMRIIRLEQAANAIVRRELTSHGAFAVLQGWHMKFYIKKPEVLIGRATEDFKVDIDLGREGRNSRVSRRQAIIRMDHEGSFHMRNLSRYPVFVNCVELTTNKSIRLTSSCLIEIKGMAFLFETNEACIKQYVDSVKNKTLMKDKL
uniref:uncharacterized protein LOC122579970 n=1 Tax=Erigeron canadensis TaxID=72917 RepID=UPI001CB8FAA1|nr:uncharacterized protein LOC122579970 [Erigeron canadensis]